MRAPLVLCVVDYLLKPEIAHGVWGLATLKRGLEAVSGPLGIQPLASQIYGLYTGLVYLTPIVGGIIADRWIGRTPTVIVGAMLMVAGHLMMAFEHLFLVALMLLIVGNGAFKPNIATQVGGLYQPDDPRRDRAYSVFYVGINVGAFFSPLVCGSLGENVGWHYGFASAGIGMAIGLATYLAGLRRLPKQQFQDIPVAVVNATNPDLKKSLLGVVLYFAVLTFAELRFSLMGFSFVWNMACNASRSTVMGIWLATSFLGNIAAGWIGSFWSTLSHASFFLLIAALAVVAAYSIQLAKPVLRAVLSNT